MHLEERLQVMEKTSIMSNPSPKEGVMPNLTREWWQHQPTDPSLETLMEALKAKNLKGNGNETS